MQDGDVAYPDDNYIEQSIDLQNDENKLIAIAFMTKRILSFR